MSREQLERAKKKSVQKDPVRVSRRKKLLTKIFIYGAIAGMVLSVPVYASCSQAINEIEISQTLKESNDYAVELINRCTHRTSDNQGYYYDESEIAQGLLEEPEVFDANLYGVYTHIGYEANGIDEMNKIMSWVNSLNKNEDLVTYANFEDYYKNKGFTDKDGNLNVKKFRENAARIIEAQEILKSSSYRGVNIQ